MEKVFNVKILLENGEEKVEKVSAKDELGAMDSIMKQYKKTKHEIIDMKII